MERRSSNRQTTRQSGYALILMVVGLMGLGGAVIAGFTQGAKQDTEHQRYLHNQRVLQEAKQALLQYAYNYPQLGPGQNDGPGRLPCPDTDNDGDENYVASCNGDMVGRFPWKVEGLDFYDARDASGEPLWYAVSNNFGRGGSSAINSDTTGGITVEDRSGATIHDAAAGSGVVAIIIAPGPPIARNGAMQVRGTADEKKDEENYLDLFGAVDNADFVDDDADNGFVTGPIRDVITGDLLVNDQMIVVTAAEVHAMAEMATLQAYREAIKASYLDIIGSCTGAGTNRALCETGGGTWTPNYPWLYDYREVYNIAELSDFYPTRTPFEVNPIKYVDPSDSFLSNYGRIPAMFGNYFAANKSQPIETTLEATLTIDFSDRIVARTGSWTSNLNFVSTHPRDHVLEMVPSGIVTDVFFEDIGTGRLSTNIPAQPTANVLLYFWKGSHGDPPGEWTMCTDDGNGISELSDCDDGIEYEILKVEFELAIPAGVGFDVDFSAAVGIAVDAAVADKHAYITGTIQGSDFVQGGTNVPVISASYEIDRHFHFEKSDESFVMEEFGDLTLASLLSGNTELALKMIYYPELPAWAFANGWHNSIRMAYADTYLPSNLPAPTDCEPLPLPPASNDCLSLPDEQGARRDIASLLVIAGEHDWVDDNTDAPVIVGLEDELRDVFDDGNENNNRSFSTARGNDQILIIATEP